MRYTVQRALAPAMAVDGHTRDAKQELAGVVRQGLEGRLICDGKQGSPAALCGRYCHKRG